MTLYCRVFHDGVAAGPGYPIAHHYPEQTDAELMDVKEASARDKGWNVDRVDATHLHYWKEYPEGTNRRRSDRYLEILVD